MENKDVFIAISWPDIQVILEFEGADENACLINESPFIEEYGASAYFVRKSWLDEINTKTLKYVTRS